MPRWYFILTSSWSWVVAAEPDSRVVVAMASVEFPPPRLEAAIRMSGSDTRPQDVSQPTVIFRKHCRRQRFGLTSCWSVRPIVGNLFRLEGK